MEHRCTQRIQAKLEVIILKQGLPVGVGVIRNGNRWGLYIESDFKHLEMEHQICLSVVRAKPEKPNMPALEIDGIVIHKSNKGFGLEIDIGSPDQAELFTRMLKNSSEAHVYYQEPLKIAANA